LEFRRGRLQTALFIPVLGLLAWIVVDRFRAGEGLAAGANLLLFLLGCYATVWLVRTPFAILSQGGMKLYLASGLRPRTVEWDQVSDIVPRGERILYIVLLTGRPIELHLGDIAPESREAFAEQVRSSWQTHLTSASG